MTFEAIRAVIEGHVSTWTDAPIAWDSVDLTPDVIAAKDAKSPWISVTINHGESRTACLGDEPEVRRTGLIQIQCFTAEGIGSATAAGMADSIAAHLQYYTSGQLETLAASVQRVGPSDGWYQYNVSLPFRAG